MSQAESEPFQFISYDAKRWEMYHEKDGAEKAAAEMTANFNMLVRGAFVGMSKGLDPMDAIYTVRNCMVVNMEKHKKFGANDSEPLQHLRAAIRKVFNLPE